MLKDQSIILPVKKNPPKSLIFKFEEMGVYLYFDKAIAVVQKYIKNRKYKIAYSFYRNTLAHLNDQKVSKSLVTIDEIEYVCIFC